MDKIEELKLQYPRIYDIKDGIIWVLCRNPLLGQELNKKHNFVYESGPLDQEAQKFWILYRYDDKAGKIYLLSISPVTEQENIT